MSEVRTKGRATRRGRGISNIVAVLILIFIVIVSSSIVYVIVTDYAVRLSTNAGVEITNAQITSIPNGQSTLTLSVANTGTVAETIDVSVTHPETKTIQGLTAYAYFSSSSGEWSLIPYPYTGIIPSNYFATITGWSPPYSYGTPSYQNQKYLGMTTQPFPSKFSNLNQEGSITSGYIAVGTFNVPQYSLYEFQIETDDGTAIWINGPSTNGWIDVFQHKAWNGQPQGANYYSANETLRAGTYQIAIEWINIGGPGVSAVKITTNSFPILPSLTSSVTVNVTQTYTLATNLQGGATAEQTFLLPFQFTPGQNVTIVVTASSSLGTTTTATTVVVS